MSEERTAILMIVSRLLGYPDESFYNERSDIEECMKDYITSEKVQINLAQAMKSIFEKRMRDIQELYVETFDHKEKTSLYLTAHELGDSRNRGHALILLQNMIRETGYVHTAKDLADYIPMLLEFLAVAPESSDMKQLERRLACATYRILNNLSDENPYGQIFTLLQEHIFGSPTPEEIAQFEKEQENTDLDPLPYPLLYG